MWGFFIAEVTNPLLTTYDILQKNGYPEKKIGFLAQIFGISFIFCRIWSCPMLNIEWQMDPTVPMNMKLSGGCLTMLGLVWLVKIFEKILEALAGANADEKIWKIRLRKVREPINLELAVYYGLCMVYSFAAIVID